MLCSARALIYAPWLAGSNPRATDVTKKQLCFNNLFNNPSPVEDADRDSRKSVYLLKL
jgi:hypothetical protein